MTVKQEQQNSILADTIGLLHRLGPLEASELRAMAWGLTQTDLGQMVRSGYVTATLSEDGRRLYRATNSGRRRVDLPIDTAGTTPGRLIPVAAGKPYHCPELRPFANRRGANDALAMPSRFGDRLRWRDGRETTHPDHKEKS